MVGFCCNFVTLKPLINKEVIILNLLEEKRTLMKLLIELMHERKAVASLYEAVEKRLNRIEEIEK